MLVDPAVFFEPIPVLIKAENLVQLFIGMIFNGKASEEKVTFGFSVCQHASEIFGFKAAKEEKRYY